jgi:inosine-uridine nucleoside N-ribohydrolase
MRANNALRVSSLYFTSRHSKAQGKNYGLLQCVLSILFLFLGCDLPCAKATTVWLDTDCSIGSPFREVDDAFAILLAFRGSNLRIAGISTTYGNASLGRTTAVTRDLVRRFGGPASDRNPKVHPGARSRQDLGLETVATRALAEALQENRSVVYLALGPLTNLATFEMLHPELASRIQRVIFVGGTTEKASLRFGARHPIQIHDANVFKDPEAVRRVLQAKIPVNLVPIATSSQIMLNARDLKEIGRNSEAGDYLRKNSVLWLWFWVNFVGTEGGPVFDTAAVVAALDPSLLGFETGFAAVHAPGSLLLSKDPRPHSQRVLFCPRLGASARQFVRQKLGARGGIESKRQNSGRPQP